MVVINATVRWRARAFRLAASCSLLFCASRAVAQDPGTRDSINALFSAKAALRTFEQRWRTEIASLVTAPDIVPFANCEIRIGLGFCYGPSNGRISYSHFGTTPNAARFAPDLVPRSARRRARALLDDVLSKLRQARTIIPGDQFIAGQLVRLSLERGDPEAALEDALDCSAARWWCGVLRGHVLHMIGVERLADSVWSDALYNRMPVEERCLWLDPTDVIRSDSLRQAVAEMECAARVKFSERLWWLSDPLYLTPGNERRSEHLSRQVALLLDAFSTQRLDSAYVDMIERGLRQTQAEELMMFGGDMAGLFRHDPPDITLSRVFAPAPPGYEELVRRLGVPGYFHITRPDPGSAPQMVALLPRPRYAFVPSAAAIMDPVISTPGHWNILDPEQYESYSLTGLEFVDLDYQVAFFRRGDSSRLVAASDLQRNPRLARRGSTAALVLRRDFTESGAIQHQRLPGSLFIGQATVPAGRTYVSMEILSRDSSVAGRVRFGAGPPAMPPQRVTISDVMLIEPRMRLPADLDDATPLILGSNVLERRRGAGIYWEMYGLANGEIPEIVVSVTRDRSGVLARVSQVITRRPLTEEMTIKYDDRGGSGLLIESRAVDLDLAALTPGRYTLSLLVRADGQQPVQTSRTVEIVER